MKKTVYIIDAYNLFYRMFYAIPDLRTSDGTPANAVFGVVKMLLSLHQNEKPDYVVFAADGPGKTFRTDLYEEYKATRDRMPDELRIQQEYMFEFLDMLHVPVLVAPGYEADDIIGALATRWKGVADLEVVIASSDKDLFQFIGENVAVYDMMKQKWYHHADAVDKFGVEPKYVVDYLSIVGDTSDNIPGVAGIGPKGAVKLISQYGSLEQIYEHLDDISGRTHDLLVASKDVAFLSKQLASIAVDMPLEDVPLGSQGFADMSIFTPELIEFLEKFQFRSLIPKEHRTNKSLKDEFTLHTIETLADLDNLFQIIKQSKSVNIATWGEGINLAGVSVCMGDKNVYQFLIDMVDCHDFLDRLVQLDIVLQGFDLKEDLRRILFFLQYGPSGKSGHQAQLF